MQLLLFKTDISSKKRLNQAKKILANNPVIYDWTVDRDDIDNVLRIEGDDNLGEKDVIRLMNACGLSCEVLPD